MSPAFEAYLARIYTDSKERGLFLADPRGRARAAGLARAEVEALASIDGDGLGLAATSFERKRESSGHGGRWASLVHRLREPGRAG